MAGNNLKIHTELIDEFLSSDDQDAGTIEPNSDWSSLRDEGSELWLDTGNIKQASEQWTSEFSGLTTNNSLLNDEIQNGTYDDFVARAGERLRDLSQVESQNLTMEMAFLLNALHGRRLVNQFDCRVSVECHTDLAYDVEGTVEVGQRFHEIEPDHFVIKVPFTPEGVIAARRLREEGIPVNQTVAFSVRQNYVIAMLSKASYGNVFMGRVNSLFQENKLPEVKRMGEKLALASNKTLAFLRKNNQAPTRQIAASFRSGDQVMNLGGVDVLTIPPDVAEEYLELTEEHRTTGRLRVDGLLDDAENKPGELLSGLCVVGDDVRDAVEQLQNRGVSNLSPEALRECFRNHGAGDLFPDFTDEQFEQGRKDGKVPDLTNWQDELNDGDVALDSLLTLGGIHAFSEAQANMDRRIREQVQ